MKRIEDVFRAKRNLLYFTIVAVMVSILIGYMNFLVVFSRYAREVVYSAGWEASNVLQLVLYILWSSSLLRLT
jgi:hydrogenase maturation factor